MMGPNLAALPDFPGLTIRIKRTTGIWPVKIQVSQAGYEQRAVLASQPRFRYTLEYEFLNANEESGDEIASLMGFIDGVRGRLDSFTIEDPITHDDVNVRLDPESAEFEQFGEGVWKGSLPLISVLGSGGGGNE